MIQRLIETGRLKEAPPLICVFQSRFLRLKCKVQAIRVSRCKTYLFLLDLTRSV